MPQKEINPWLDNGGSNRMIVVNQYNNDRKPILDLPLISDANDISGNGMNGTTHGSTSFTTPVNGVLNLGQGNYMDVNDNDLLSFCDSNGDKPFSVSFKFKATVTPDQGVWFLNKRDGTNIEWQIYYRYITGTLRGMSVTCYTENDSSKYIGAYNGAQYNFSAENHIVVTYDGSASPNGFKIYINKVSQSLTALNSGNYTKMSNTSAKLTIGKAGWDSVFYINNYIKKIKIYDYVIGQNKVDYLFNES